MSETRIDYKLSARFEDGVYDATDIQNTLITSAFSLNTQRVVDILTDKFPSASIPDFKPVVDHFLNTSGM